MIAVLKHVMELARTWPQEDQEALAEAAREIKALRDGVYILDPDERAAIEEGLAQARRGEFADEAEMEGFWKRLSA